MTDIYRDENLPASIDGIVKEKILYRGGNLTLIVRNEQNTDSAIAIAIKFRDVVKKGDRFIKLPNSNKCIIERNDSIMYSDCYDIPEDLKDSLGVIEEWPVNLNDRWIKKK